MDNIEAKQLIDAFKEYRDLLIPIQTGLTDFAQTYELMKENVDKLNASFGGEAKERLEHIYHNLEHQSEKATDLAARIDQFSKVTSRYMEETNRLIQLISRVADRLGHINDIEAKAEEQIGRLDALMEEKNKNYNVKELQRTLDSYNTNVQRVSEFINTGVADTLSSSQKRLEGISQGIDAIVKRQKDEAGGLERLAETYNQTNILLKKVVEKDDVNEEYIFEIIDKWAKDRKVKTKG